MRTLLNKSGGSGVETYHYPSSSKGKKLAQAIHEFVIQGTPQRNRGVKTANFYVLRKTKMPAVLIEYGFMDDPSLTEARLMLKEDFQRECARETAQGICKYFGVPYKGINEPPKERPPMRRVIVDGKIVIDTAYKSKLLDAVEKAIDQGAKEITVKIR